MYLLPLHWAVAGRKRETSGERIARQEETDIVGVRESVIKIVQECS